MKHLQNPRSFGSQARAWCETGDYPSAATANECDCPACLGLAYVHNQRAAAEALDRLQRLAK